MNMDNWPVTLWTTGMTGVGRGEKVVSLAIIINSPGTGTYGDCDICLKNLFTSRSSLCGGCTLQWSNVEIGSIYIVLTILLEAHYNACELHSITVCMDLRLIRMRSVNYCAGVQFSIGNSIDSVVHGRSQRCPWWCQLNVLNNSNLLNILLELIQAK